MSSKSDNRLFRYTNTASALDIIVKKRLTLLSPKNWEDQNDAEYLKQFATVKGLKTFGALCFTETFETSQHWSLFANGVDGVRLEFDRAKIESHVSRVPEAELKPVNYCKIDEAEANADNLECWPFVKRYPYEGEAEVRIIYGSKSSQTDLPSIPIELDCLKRVTLSPRLPEALKKVMVDTFKHAIADSEVSVARSTLLGNERWIKPILRHVENLSNSAPENST